jgi:hypothetical protein
MRFEYLFTTDHEHHTEFYCEDFVGEGVGGESNHRRRIPLYVLYKQKHPAYNQCMQGVYIGTTFKILFAMFQQ